MKKTFKNIFLLLFAFIFITIPINTKAQVITKKITLQVKNGSDITEAWNQATKQAKNDTTGKIYEISIPTGTYTTKDQLKIWGNTHIKLNGSTITNNSGAYTMLRLGNKSDYDTANNGKGLSGYGIYSNITIEDGTFNGGGFDQALMRFGHASNITLKNMNFTNVGNAHFVEFGAVKDVLIDNCNFNNFKGDFANKTNIEALQFDALAGDHFSSFNPDNDETPSKNVTIKNSSFKNLQRGLGTHTGIANSYFENFTIINNTFENITGYAIIATNYKNANISNNTIKNCGAGIMFRTMEKDHTNFYTSKKYSNTHKTYININSKINNNAIIVANGYKKEYTNNSYGIALYGENLTKKTGSAPAGDFRVSGVTLTNNTITMNTNGYGIWLEGAVKNTISKNKITTKLTKFKSGKTTKKEPSKTDPLDGIRLSSSRSNKIINNSITNSTSSANAKISEINGITLNTKSNSNTIEKNTIKTSGKDGIFVEKSNSNKILSNTINSPKRHGINLTSSNENTINLNKISSPKEFGIRLVSGNKNNIKENSVKQSSKDAIHLEKAKSNKILFNTISDITASKDAIYLTSSTSNVIEKNTITNIKRYGINIDKSNSNKVYKNTIKKTKGFAIRVFSSKSSLIEKNTISDINNSGIYLEKSNSNKILSNKITNIKIAKDGIYLTKSNSNKIEKNTITKSKRHGINLENSSSNTFKSNSIKDTSGFGIRLVSSSKNKITSNTFTNNGSDAIHLEKSNEVTISQNKITKAKRDGINITNSNKIITEKNTITSSKRYGIKAEKKEIKKDSGNKISKSGTRSRSWKK